MEKSTSYRLDTPRLVRQTAVGVTSSSKGTLLLELHKQQGDEGRMESMTRADYENMETLVDGKLCNIGL